MYRIIQKLVSNSAKMENQRHRTDERVKIFELFIASNSVVATQRMFKKYFNVRRAPSRKCIINVVRRFRETGAICSQNRIGSPKSARTSKNIHKLEKSIEENRAPRSPDLNPLDFFLWGYCKENVYRNNPRCINDLRRNVENIMSKISAAMCSKVICNFEKRVHNCMLRQGDHFQHIAL